MARSSLFAMPLLALACDAGVPARSAPARLPPPTSCSAEWKGDLQLGTPLFDEATDLWIDPKGQLFVVGYEKGVVGYTSLEPAGDAAGVVHRIAPAGTLLETTRLNTPGADVAGTPGRLLRGMAAVLVSSTYRFGSETRSSSGERRRARRRSSRVSGARAGCRASGAAGVAR